MDKLILWDIDGTLISGGGVAGEALRAAMTRFYGRASNQERFSYAGKTDAQIILETFPERQQEELLESLTPFTIMYLEELEQRRAAMQTRGRVLPGVVAVLERLARAHVIQSVLTGNIKPGALFKLELLGLLPYLDLESGAFGSDHHRRNELVPIARARAEQRHGRTFSPHEVVVIGDTPHDVACGQAGGARTVAVATGPYRVDELRATGADAVLASLEDCDVTVAAILAGAG